MQEIAQRGEEGVRAWYGKYARRWEETHARKVKQTGAERGNKIKRDLWQEEENTSKKQDRKTS